MTHLTKENTNNINSLSDITPRPLKTWRKVVRIIVIALILLILTFSYIFLFSGATKDGMIGTNYVGVLKTDNFVDAKLGELIKVEKIQSVKSLEIGEIVVYKINGLVYSGSVASIDLNNKFITVENTTTEKAISFDVIIGKQGKKIAVLGLIWGFCASTIGVVVLTLILLIYVTYITFSKLNIEETPHSVLLYLKYKQQKTQEKERKKMLKAFKKNEGFDELYAKMISGSLGDNLIELMSYSSGEHHDDVTTTYNKLLDKVYNAHIYKESLSRTDRIRISNVVELSAVVDVFDEDMTYKLIDLILRETLHDFDSVGYEKLCSKFLSKKISIDDALNFGKVLYVLINKNPKLITSVIKKIVCKYEKKVKDFDNDNPQINEIVNNFKKLFSRSGNIRKLKA